MSTAHLVEPHLAGFQEDFNALGHELAKVIVGQADVIEQALIAAVAGGHLLIEGVPGLNCFRWLCPTFGAFMELTIHIVPSRHEPTSTRW